MSSIPHSRPLVEEDDIAAVSTCLQSGLIAEGAEVSRFEEAVGKYLSLRGGVATSSGSFALYLALKALGIGFGDDVIVPTYVCRSVADAIVNVNANPVFCDIGENWCMNSETVAAAITKKTKAVVVVHIFGICANVAAIAKFGIPVIEDCCQSFGAHSENGVAGALGDLSFFSFHATKCLTTGEGGMVFARSEELSSRLRVLKDGLNDRFPRFLAPMTDMQACLGLNQLKKYGSFILARKRLREQYLQELKNLESVSLRFSGEGLFRFVVRTSLNVDQLIREFSEEGTSVRKGVDTLLHRIFNLSDKDFPNAVQAFNQTLSIPFYPALTNADFAKVVNSCKKLFKQDVVR